MIMGRKWKYQNRWPGLCCERSDVSPFSSHQGERQPRAPGRGDLFAAVGGRGSEKQVLWEDA